MRRVSSILLLFLAFSLTTDVSAGNKPLPVELMQAKTVYIELGEYIPTKKDKDHGEKASYVGPCYETLTKWGRLKVVSDPKEADVIFHISSQALASPQRIDTTQVRGSVTVTNIITTIDVIETSTEKKLWSGNGLWVWAFSAKWIPRNIVNSLRKEVEAQAKADGQKSAGSPDLSARQAAPEASIESAKAPTRVTDGSASPAATPASVPEQNSSTQNPTAEVQPTDQQPSLGDVARQYREKKAKQQSQNQEAPAPPPPQNK
jgi:hypothetical protein